MNLQGNFQQLDIAYGFDHVPFSNTSGLPPSGQSGLHKVIHALANSVTSGADPLNYPITPPTPVALTGELFTTESNDGFGVDEILWYQTAAGKLSQLTSNIQPLASTNGYTYIAGGLIVQWGQITSTASTFQTLTFSTNNKAFPNNCFAVFTQPYGSNTPASSQATVDIRKSTLSKTSFDWAFVTNSGQYTGFFWVAIGN